LSPGTAETVAAVFNHKNDKNGKEMQDNNKGTVWGWSPSPSKIPTNSLLLPDAAYPPVANQIEILRGQDLGIAKWIATIMDCTA
jgi:hypothetical protein